MKGITIQDVDERGLLAVDLRNILEFVGERGIRSRWVLSGVEAGGEQAAAELHSLSDERSAIDGNRLLKLARDVWQVINGKFEAIEEGRDSPWLTIFAVDSSAFDVVTCDTDVLEKLRGAFLNVKDLPKSAL